MPNGYIYTWTGKTSANFGVASNWYNQSTGTAATSVPGINDEALINSNGVLTGSGNVFDLGLTGTGGTLTIAGALAGTNLFMASNVSVASGASLVFSNAIQIGDYDQYSIVSHTAANVAILAGGLIRGTLPTAGYYDFYVGVAGGTGTLSVSGQGAFADAGARGFDVGDAGIGVISVGAGGSISGGTGDSYQSGVAEQLGITLGSPGGNGSLIISGAGAGATFGDIVEVGYGGTGTISVQDGGTLTAGDGSFALDIADQQGNSVGAGSVSFAGGSGTLNGLVEVGTYGNGSLSLSAGATLTMTETSDSPSVTYWSAIAGVESGSSGTISVGSQSLLTTGHGLNIGVAGYGELDINSGRVALSSPTGGSNVALDIGLYAGSSGLVTVTAGLLQDVSDTGMIVGQSGSGTLDVNAGGTLICGGAEGFGGLFIGQDNGSSGTLAVGGAGATLTVTGQLQVASAGTGVFTLSGGSHASITSPSPNSLSSFVLGGNGGVGHATITGAGTVLNDTGQMLVGGTGTGTLTVTSGALLSVAAAAGQTIPDAIVASASASVTSAVSVTGSGSTWSLDSALLVGNTGRGALTIQAGGHVFAGSVTIGGYSGSVGTAVVAGRSSLLKAGALQIGTSQAAGTMAVSSGMVSISGNADINGALSLSHAGTFAATDTVTIESGSVVHGAGLLEAGSIVDLGRIVVNGGTMKCIGPITGSGSLRVANGNLTLGNGEASSVGIDFGAGGTLTAATPAAVAGTISGWTTGDVFHFVGARIVSDKVSGHVLSLFNATNHLVGTLTFAGGIPASHFTLTADGHGTLLSYHP